MGCRWGGAGGGGGSPKLRVVFQLGYVDVSVEGPDGFFLHCVHPRYERHGSCPGRSRILEIRVRLVAGVRN